MTLDELRAAVAAGPIDTVLLGFCDMQGRLQGKRLVADHFVDEVVEHGAEGCNYLLAVDVDMNTVDGLRDVVVGDGLRRLRAQARPRHAAARALARGARRCAWPTSPGTTARDVVASPRQILRRQLAGWPSAAGRALAATELEFIVFRDTYEAAWRKALPRPRPGQLLQRRLLDARHLARRAADRPDPARDGRGRPAGRELQGRVQLRPARDQLHATRPRSARPTRTRSTRTPRRRSPARRAWRSRSWPSSTSARATRATSTSRCARPTAASCSATSRSCSSRFVAGQLACLRELTLFLAPNVNSYKRYAEGSFAPDRGRLGQRQPHLRAARRRPRAGRCAWRTACRAAT